MLKTPPKERPRQTGGPVISGSQSPGAPSPSSFGSFYESIEKENRPPNGLESPYEGKDSQEQKSQQSSTEASSFSSTPVSPVITPTSPYDDDLSDLSGSQSDAESLPSICLESERQPQEYERNLELVFSVSYWHKKVESIGISSDDKKQSQQQRQAQKEQAKKNEEKVKTNERQSLDGYQPQVSLKSYTVRRYTDCPHPVEKNGPLFDKLDYYQIGENEDFLNAICDYERVIVDFLKDNIDLGGWEQAPILQLIRAFAEDKLEEQIQSSSDTELQVQAYRYKSLAEYYLQLVAYNDAGHAQTDYFEGQKGLDAMCIKPRIVNLGLVLKTTLSNLTAFDQKHVPFNPADYNFRRSLLSSGLYPVSEKMPERIIEGRMFFYCPFPNFLTEMQYSPIKKQGDSKLRSRKKGKLLKLKAGAWHMVMFYQYLEDVGRAKHKEGCFTTIQPEDIEIFKKITSKVKLLPKKEKFEPYEAKPQFILEAYNNFVSPETLQLAKDAGSFETKLERQIRDFTSWFFLYLCPEIRMDKQALGLAIDKYHCSCEEEIYVEHEDQQFGRLASFDTFPKLYFTGRKKATDDQIIKELGKKFDTESTSPRRALKPILDGDASRDSFESVTSLRALLGGSSDRKQSGLDDVERLEGRVQELEKEKIDLTRSLNKKNDQITSLTQVWQKRLNTKNAELKTAQGHIKSLGEKLSTLGWSLGQENIVEAVTGCLTNLQKKLHGEQRQVQTLESSVASKTTEIRTLFNEINTLKEERKKIASLEKELAKKTKLDSDHKLQVQEDLQQPQQQLQEGLSAKQKEVNAKIKQLDSMTKKLKNAETEFKKIQKEVYQAKSSIARHIQEQLDSKKHIGELKAQYDSVKEQKIKFVPEHKVEVEALTGECDALQANLNSSEEALAKLQNTLPALRQKQSESKRLHAEKISALHKKLQDSDRLLTQLGRTLSTMRPQLHAWKGAESSKWHNMKLAICFGSAVVLATAPLWLPSLVMMLHAHVIWLTSGWFNAGLLITASIIVLAGLYCARTCPQTVNTDPNKNDRETSSNAFGNLNNIVRLQEKQISQVLKEPRNIKECKV